ncbi:hypothetical protein IGI04_036390 [Brassica rapa subsp. trilocularis]|uniref:Uncharacterized protein n=1 Tax=Brassica rapa subsp. trilocularis TaxID=1813537 RepID=A0ABQ7LG50_BRACM|nr:hypothetical protein IGI04_036390 [Brassica rapa subsp. trilocularis]
MLVLGLSTLALLVDCSGDFGPRGLSVQYTLDVRGCPPAHTRRPCVSVSTQRTSVAVRVCPSAHTGRMWLSISTHISTLVLGLSTLTLPVDCSAHTGRASLSVCVRLCPLAHTGRPWLSISTHISTLVLGFNTLTLPVDCSSDFGPHGLYVQYTQDVCGCTPAHTGRPWLSVCVCLCPSAHTGRLWLSISTHISTLALGISMLTLPVDCSVDFGPRGLSVQYTKDFRRCPSAHTGRLCLSISTHRTSMCVRLCPSAHTGPMWLSISTHISMLVLGLSTLTLPVDCSGDFGLRGLSVQYTQDVSGCPSAHTRCLWLSVWVRVCPSAHTGCPWLSIKTHISTLLLGLNTLALPVDCSGYFGPRGLSVQYTQDVRGCPSAHTGCLLLSVNTHRTSVAVRVCPCVFVTTHRTYVAVHQYTYQHAGPWTQHADPSRGLFGTHISTLVLGLSTLTLPVDCSGDFSPHGLSVQYTQDVCGCPPAHTGRPWLSVCVRVCPSSHTGRPWLSISTHISTLVLGLSTLTLPVDCSGDFCPCGLSVQYTQDVRGCPSAHTGRPCVSVSAHRTSVGVCVCPSAHTVRLWLSISMHISTLVLGLSTLTLPVDCSGDFGPRGLSVQYTQDISGCPSAHTGCPWLSVCVRVFPSAHTGCPWLSVCVRQHTQDVCGCPSVHISAPHTGRPWLSISTHISTLVLGFNTLTLPVDCSSDFGPHGLYVQYTQDVCGCTPAHTGRPWLSVCVCLCPSAHTGRPWLSISTHISTLALGISMLTLPVDCSVDFGPRGLSVQYTKDFRGCPSAHTGPHTGPMWLSISTHISMLVLGLSTLTLPVDCSGDFGPRGLSVQYTQDVSGCPSAHTRCPWLSVWVRVCPSAHRGCPWLSIKTHISTLLLGLNTLALPVDCSGYFGPSGLSVQYTQDVRGCPSAHTGCLLQSVNTHRASVAVRVCPCVFVTTHRTYVAVHQYTYQHAGPWTQHADPSRGLFGTHISTLVLGLSTLTLPMDCSGDFSPHGLSVQYTQDVCGCPPAHTGRPWLSVCVRVCPSSHTGRPWLSISTHISTLVLGLSTLTLPVDCSGDFCPCGLSVQYTQDVRGCPSAHTGRPCVSVSAHRTSVGVCVCPSAHTVRLWLSISMHISTLVLGLSTLTLPVDCSGDFGPRGLSVQYTQDISGCPSAHTGCPWLSVCVRVFPSAHTGCPWLSVCVRQHTQDVCGCPSVHISAPHTGRPWLSISTHISTLVLGFNTLTLPVDCSSDFGPHGLYVQYTQDVCGCTPAHTGRPWLSVCVCLCPSAHTGRLWLSISTHISTLALGISMLTLPVDCSVDFGPRGLSVQYTKDFRRCPSAHTGRLCLSISTHRTSMCVRLCPSAHTGPMWLSISTHISMLVLGLSTLTLPVDCSGDFGPRGLSVQYTQDVSGCPSAHTRCLWLSVWVRVCPSAHTGCPWLSIKTHISTLLLGLNTLALPVDCSGYFGPSGLSVQYTQDVRGCPSAHTGCLLLSVNTHRTSVAVRVCPCVFVTTHRTYVAVHQYTYQHAGPWTQHADPSRGLFG